MIDDIYLYQHKDMQEGTKSHNVKVAELEELRHNAIDEHRRPCYIIEYPGQRWFLLSEDDFHLVKSAHLEYEAAKESWR